MKILHTFLLISFMLVQTLRADDLEGRKTYECLYMENPPYGVTAWATSEMVKTGEGKESRFVPYNSDAAKQLILDATTPRDVSVDPALQDHETSFYMVYNAQGWYLYIHCQEPDVATFVDEGKDIALEIFFSPGLRAVPYYQMMVNQSKSRVTHFDWGMPHRHYRSLKDSVRIESLPLETGYATFLFVPWERLYDRLPLNGDHWRFSLIRWGPSVTWGGQVHDTGNFGLVHFKKPSIDQRLEIKKRILRSAWSAFRAEAKKATAYWSDDEVGDLTFYNQLLRPAIDQHTALGESLGKPASWNAETVKKSEAAIGDWMEFKHVIAELRSDYLLAHHFVEKASPLTVASNFEGGSVKVIEIDCETRAIRVIPGGDPRRGWPCWWYFRVDGIVPGETITVELSASQAVVGKPGLPMQTPLSSKWATPHQAMFSTDGKTWQHTARGERREGAIVYKLTPDKASVFVAWGPPYTPAAASEFVRKSSLQSPHAEAVELCRSREGRHVPMLHILEGDLPEDKRFGVWVQARQHAWESGSSWVAQGFGEWVLGETVEAGWLRQHAEIFIVPIMDVDNAATGDGGKDAQPHDHNRDWSAKPNWKEVAAAQKRIHGLTSEKRMDVFLDLHNPAPGDPTFFYILDDTLLKEPMIQLRNHFVDLAYERISKIKPMIPMSNTPKVTGASYHPLWRQISTNWVSANSNPHTVSLCLETIWNGPNSTTTGYRAVGASLAESVRDYLSERPGLVE
jgi:hypothetical protein